MELYLYDYESTWEHLSVNVYLFHHRNDIE